MSRKGRAVTAFLVLMLLTTGLRAMLFVAIPVAAKETALSPVLAGLSVVFLNLGFSLALWTMDWVPGTAAARIRIGLLALLILALALPFIRTARVLVPVLLGISYSLGMYFGNGVGWLATIVPSGQRGRYMGLHEFMAMVAYTVGPLFAGVLMPTLGWRGVLMAWALLTSGLGLTLIPLMGDPPAPASPAATGEEEPPGIDLRLLAHAGIGACFTSLMSGFLNLVPLWVVYRWGIPAATTATIVGTARLAGLLGSPVSGTLSDRLDRLALTAVYIVLAILCLTGLAITPFGPVFVAVLALLCLVTSALSPVYYAVVSDAYPAERQPREMALVVALGASIGQVGLPLLMSLGMGYSPNAAFYLAVGTCLASLGGVGWLRLQGSRQRPG